MDPDDRILVSLSFTLARRESMKLGQRVRGGHYAKLRSGGFVGVPPDGYINKEVRTDNDAKLHMVSIHVGLNKTLSEAKSGV
jgi:hypothetical protein